MRECPQCGAENPEDATKCKECGSSLESNMAGNETTQVIGKGAEATTAVIPRDGSATQPLPTLPPFTPLPEDAIVGSERGEYRVTNLQEGNDTRHVYTGVARSAVRPCPNCGYLSNGGDAERCAYCGFDLSDEPGTHLHVTIRESNRSDPFPVESRLARLGLETPHLRPPLAAFSRRVGGHERHYLVLPPPPAEWLGNLPPKQELTKVLDWGVSLSQALSVLHEHKIAFGPMEKERLGLEAGRANLADFAKAVHPAEGKHVAQDIRQLAAAMFYLATGEQHFTSRTDLPPEVQSIFSRALSGNGGYATAAAFGSALDSALADIRRPPSINFVVGRRTDVGQARKLNEDSLLTLNLVWNNQSVNHPTGIFAVADGMGGHAAGEVASGLALEAVGKIAMQDLMSMNAGDSATASAQWVKKAMSAANDTVYGQVEATRNDMGTTLVVALVSGDVAYIANVGDSRAYLVNEREIRQITVDHSLVERLVATGQITADEARFHPQRNVIYRTIGDKKEVEADTWQLHLQPGDSLLLCSDGLSGMLDDRTIHRLVSEAPSPQAACDSLVAAANEAGGSDNITAVLVQIAA